MVPGSIPRNRYARISRSRMLEDHSLTEAKWETLAGPAFQQGCSASLGATPDRLVPTLLVTFLGTASWATLRPDGRGTKDRRWQGVDQYSRDGLCRGARWAGVRL
jgi:hypothetical protein